jgi:hypothetical protein
MKWLGLPMALLGTLQYTLGTKLSMGWDGSAGIATCSGLDSLRTKSQWGGILSTSIHTDPGAHPGSVQQVPFYSPVYKRPGRWCLPPTPSSTEVKERIELYLYSSICGP